MAQKKKPTSTKKPAAKVATKRAPATKKPATRSSASNKQSQLVSNDRELWLVVSWIVLIAIFLGIVIKAYVVG